MIAILTDSENSSRARLQRHAQNV